MIKVTDIEEMVKIVKVGMDVNDVSRLSVGLQTIVKVEYADFIEAFGASTTSHCLGNEIRIDLNGITYCAQKPTGVTKESELPEGGE
jgi:hypothetical protein